MTKRPDNIAFLTEYRTEQEIPAALLTRAEVDSTIALVSGAGIGDLLLPATQLLDRTAYDTVSGSGVVNGQTIDSGQTWVCTGPGAATTSINAAGYIEGASNTYCHINTGSVVRRAVQRFSGPLCTIAIGLDENLTDMVHCNYSQGGGAIVTYWKTGVGSSQAVTFAANYASVPNLNDGAVHELALEVANNFAFAYADGVLISASYDANLSSVAGNWFFAQIHAAAGDKVYGVTAYSYEAIVQDRQPSIYSGQVATKSLQASTVTLGNPSGAGFSPNSSAYYYTDHANGHVFGSNGTTLVHARATVTGNVAALRASSAIGTAFQMVSNNDGTATIQHQGSTRLSFPFNTARVDQSVPQRLPSYTVATLPNVATYAQCLIYVSDGTGNKRLAVSDGTNWRFPDGAVVS